MITQLLYDRFRENHEKTLQDMYRGVFSICGEKMVLDIEDTGGSFAQEFPAMLQVSLTTASAVILVFDVTREETFEEISKLKDLINSMETAGNIPIVVLANKADNDWSIAADALEATVLLDWECGFVECSAKDRNSMDRVVVEVLNQVGKELKKENSSSIVRRNAFPSMSLIQKQEKRKRKKKNSCSIA